MIVRKVRITRKVYRKGLQVFFPTSDPKTKVVDNLATPDPKDEKFFAIDSKNNDGNQSVSTSKAELASGPLQLESEDTHEFTQVVDIAWEDHKAPNSRGDNRQNYLRMAYMTRKMVK